MASAKNEAETETKIFVHILAHLPHYYPLYMAAYELSYNQEKTTPVEIRFHKNADSLSLFEIAAMEHRAHPEVLHLVISGEHEEVYLGGVGHLTAVDDFVCASLLLSRTPLWIKTTAAKKEEAAEWLGKKQEAFEAEVRAGRFKHYLYLPKANTTLAGEILNEFDGLNALEESAGAWKTNYVKQTNLLYLDGNELTATLSEPRALAYFSIFPPDPKLEEVKAINRRLPSTSYGFSAVWLEKAQTTDRNNLILLVRLLTTIEFFIEELTDCDANILTDSSDLQASNIKQLLKEYKQEEMLKLFSLIVPDDKDAAWHGDVEWMLREFNLSRLWAYNHAFQFPDKASDGTSKGRTERVKDHLDEAKRSSFNPRCLTERLLLVQEEAFNSRIQSQVDVLIQETEALDRVTDAAKALRTLTTGSSTTQEMKAEGALSQLAILYLRGLFSGNYHKVNDFAASYGQSETFLQQLDGAARHKDKNKLHDQVDSLSDFLGSSQNWIKNSGLFEERFRLLIHFLQQCLYLKEGDAREILDKDTKSPDGKPLLIYEMKALSNDWIPGSWIIGLGNYNGNPCSTCEQFCSSKLWRDIRPGRNCFPALRRVNFTTHGKTVPMTLLGSTKTLADLRTDLERDAGKKGSLGAQDTKIDNKRMGIELTLSQDEGDNFEDLIPMVYQEKPRQRVGQTGEKLRLLHGMGWQVQFTDIEERTLKLIFPGSELDWL